MKVVLDTNVLMAAFGTRGLCESVFELCLERHEIVLSEHIFRELQRHLCTKFRMTEAQAQGVVNFLRENATVVEPAEMPTSTCRDVDDLPVLGTCQTAGADCLVTGDADLLILSSCGPTKIMTPREFYERMRQE